MCSFNLFELQFKKSMNTNLLRRKKCFYLPASKNATVEYMHWYRATFFSLMYLIILILKKLIQKQLIQIWVLIHTNSQKNCTNKILWKNYHLTPKEIMSSLITHGGIKTIMKNRYFGNLCNPNFYIFRAKK